MPRCCGGETVHQRAGIKHFDHEQLIMQERAGNRTHSFAWTCIYVLFKRTRNSFSDVKVEHVEMYQSVYPTLNLCFCRLMMAGRTVVIPPPTSPHPEHQAASTTPADAPPSLPTPHPAPQSNTTQTIGWPPAEPQTDSSAVPKRWTFFRLFCSVMLILPPHPSCKFFNPSSSWMSQRLYFLFLFTITHPMFLLFLFKKENKWWTESF